MWIVYQSKLIVISVSQPAAPKPLVSPPRPFPGVTVIRPTSQVHSMVHLITASLGLAGHAIAVYGKAMNIPDSVDNPEMTRYLGGLVWLTAQTNVLCTVYYAVAVASCLVVSETLTATVALAFPLAFALAFVLSLLYYGLDHFNPATVAARKKWSENGFPQIHVCNHLQHASATPLALLYAFTLRLPSNSPEPTVQPVLAFLSWFICMSLANHTATGLWQYPIMQDAQDAAGWIGVILLFALISGLVVGSAFLGLWIIS